MTKWKPVQLPVSRWNRSLAAAKPLLTNETRRVIANNRPSFSATTDGTPVAKRQTTNQQTIVTHNSDRDATKCREATMARKTQRPEVLARLTDTTVRVTHNPPPRGGTGPRLKGTAFETVVHEYIKDAINAAIDKAPGDPKDNTNRDFAMAAAYKLAADLCKKRYEAQMESLVINELIEDPKKNKNAGEYKLGASTGFEVTSVVSAPRRSFDADLLAQQLLRKRKVPLMVTKQLVEESKSEGASQVTNTIRPLVSHNNTTAEQSRVPVGGGRKAASAVNAKGRPSLKH